MHLHQSSKWVLLTSLVLIAASHTASARDISPEQQAAAEARKAYNRVKDNYQDLNTRVEQQARRVALEQEKLDALKAQQADTQKIVDIRKQDLDRKVEKLNAVWDQRTR